MVIKSDQQAAEVRAELQRMRNRGVSATDSRYVRLQRMLIEYEYRNRRP